jgi:hypothetical protein
MTSLGVLIILTVVAVNVYIEKCDPRDAQSLLVLARLNAAMEVQKSGKLDSVESLLRAGHSKSVESLLERYRIITHHTNGGYQIVIEPRHWTCCRPTYRAAVPTSKFW